MRPGQRKSGREVIKGCGQRGLGTALRRDDHYRRRDGQHHQTQ